MSQIVRVTLFKLDPTDLEFAIQLYRTLIEKNRKDGKPYIISATTHKLYDDPRSNGYNFMGKTRFESLEDMKYYDTECEAHAELKAKIGPKFKGTPMTVYLDA